MSVIIFFLLLTAFIAWCALPLAPALREVVRQGDVQPLVVVSRDTGHIDFFAQRFRHYLYICLPPLRSGRSTTGTAGTGGKESRLIDGTPLVRITGESREVVPKSGAVVDCLAVADGDAVLPGNMTFKQELYARASLEGGPDTLYRAVLAEEFLRLGRRSTVLRWAHCTGPFEVEEDGALYGRASSDNLLRLKKGVTFEQIGAPRIVFGSMSLDDPWTLPDRDLAPFQLPKGARALGDHHRIKGDLVIPPNSGFVGHLVITGSLYISENSHIIGDVKTHGDAVLSNKASVDGSIVSRKTIFGGEGCRIWGPLIAEGAIKLGHNAVIGLPEQPTTLSAPTIEVRTGTMIFGHAVAGESGRVKS